VSAIRAFIVDDEPLSRRAVRQLLARHDDVVVAGEFGDAIAAREALRGDRPDVVFLDVRMPAMSGLELAQGNDGSLPLVVFVTAFDEFALPAFEVDAVDFLRKPITQQRFDAAVDRVRERIRLLSSAGPSYLARLVARVRNEDVVIPIDDVDYIEADDVYAAVHAKGRRHLVRTPLDALEGGLDPSRFVRVHRSYIVATNSVMAIRRSGTRCELVLRDGVVLPVSRRRHARLASVFSRA
jgi:two-component system LytT family response regulator